MLANLGGTEIGQAHEAVFNARHKSIPTAVFVLTDGQVQVRNFCVGNSFS